MKWTRVEKHWQELASKANAERRNARLQPGAEIGTRGPEPAVDADLPAPRVDVQQETDGSDVEKD